MIPTMVIIGVLVGFLPYPWYVFGLGLVAISWPLSGVFYGDLRLTDLDTLLGALNTRAR